MKNKLNITDLHDFSVESIFISLSNNEIIIGIEGSEDFNFAKFHYYGITNLKISNIEFYNTINKLEVYTADEIIINEDTVQLKIIFLIEQGPSWNMEFLYNKKKLLVDGVLYR
jgi:hypothetical protein